MKTVLITGANKGIGLEFCRQYKQLDYRVIAVCRKSTPELKELNTEIIENVDVTKEGDVENLKNKLLGTALDTLINNAGVLEEAGLPNLDFASIERQWQVNALGPLKVTVGLLPLLAPSAKLIMITSRMGSLGDNTSGGFYGYRMSKAALNMAAVSLSHDLKSRGISVSILHPGYVRTAMTGNQGTLSPQEAVKGMIQVIDSLNLSNSGRFFHSNGKELPW